MTLPQRVTSSRIICANSSGVLEAGSTPCWENFSRTSGVFMIFTISRLSRATTSLGVAAGATTPYQISTSAPSTPASRMVCTSGRLGMRCLPVVASRRTLPALASGTTGGTPVNTMLNCPPMRSVMASALPLYGTCTMSVLVISLKSSPVRCGLLPTPGEPKLSCPGRFFARSIRSFTVCAGIDGCTAMTTGPVASRQTAAKSFTGSNGVFG